MDWLKLTDTDFFRWVNKDLANPVFDQLMPILSGNAFFYPLLAVLCVFLVWKFGARGLICVALIGLVLAFTDGFLVRTLKEAIQRSRPFWDVADARLLVGKSGSGSMPSAHAANWFSAAVIALIYFRRSWWFMLPLAFLVSFSRVYNGVHYPGDVFAGAIIGAGSATAIAWALNAAWQFVGRKWFPLWWEKFPSILTLKEPAAEAAESDYDDELPERPPEGYRADDPDYKPPGVTMDTHWVRLGYVLIAILFIGRLAYIASDTIQLAEDEAYQWVWSKHLALSYYSKPPMIAYLQFIGTSLWGNTEFGVRFLSPVISALTLAMLLRFFAKYINARAGFALVLISATTPLLAAGSVLMTVDPPSVLFWTAAMLAGWKAAQPDGATKDWVWVGLWTGLGFLSKYTALLQLACWALFFILYAPARKHLRRPGPYLALLVLLLCSVPVLIWNAQNGWITVSHVADNAGAGKNWKFTLHEFLGAEWALLNPVFFVAAAWAAIAFWRKGRRNPKLLYFFSMGAPVFIIYLLLSFRSRVLPNWIAPSVVPLFCLMVIYWDTRLRLGDERVRRWFVAGLLIGLPIVAVCHETNWIKKVTGKYLPVRLDPLHRVREWDTTALTIGGVRDMLAKEGKPTFIITAHYGFAGETSFYLPEQRDAIRTNRFVYFLSSPYPRNQYYFWPGYESRKGENAVFVRELNRYEPKIDQPPPESLVKEFESVQFLGVSNVLYHKQEVLRPLQFFLCRGLK